MKIVWDEPKRISNIKKHGLDFAELDSSFFDGAALSSVKLNRFKAIGLFDGKMISVVLLPLGREAISIISMRIANKSEYQ